MIIEQKIIEFIHLYETNYSKIKGELGIPSSDEFNVLFIYENSTQVGTNNNDLNTNIFAHTIQVEYLDEKGNEKTGEIIFKIW